MDFFKNIKKLFNTSTSIQFKNLDMGTLHKLEDSKASKSFDGGVLHNRNRVMDVPTNKEEVQKNISKAVLLNKNKVISITYEEIGLFPRSFSRVLDRFLTQLFGDVEILLLQEYRFYRYLFLTTLKTIFLLIFVPLAVNFLSKNYIVKPLTEYFWNAKQTEIFLNSYEQKRAFAELHDFEDKLYFEALMFSGRTDVKCLSKCCALNKCAALKKIDISEHSSENSVPWETPWETPSKMLSKISSPDICLLGKQLSIRDFFYCLRSKQISAQHLVDTGSPKTAKLSESSNLIADEVVGRTNVGRTNVPTKSIDTAPNGLVDWDLISHKQQSVPLSIRDFFYCLRSKQISAQHLVEDRHICLQRKQLALQSILIKESQFRLQEKTMDLAQKYNKYSIEALTNLFSDLLSFLSFIYLLITLEIQINITKSFLLEVFFSFEDSKKSLLILLITDLLVGYHSSNLWELLFQFVFYHYGIPESQTGVYLLVATLPVLLDVLFKYLIFRHLNRSSPATVATYHAILE